MMNKDINNLYRDAEKNFIIEMLNFYADMTVESEGEIDILGLFACEPLLSLSDSLDLFTARVNGIIDDLKAGHSLRTADWWSIYDAMKDGIAHHDADDGIVVLCSQEEYDTARDIALIIEMCSEEFVVPDVCMTALLADAIQCRFGNDMSLLNHLGDIRDYTNNLSVHTNSLGLATAVAMVLTGSRNATDTCVSDLAENICQNIPD